VQQHAFSLAADTVSRWIVHKLGNVTIFIGIIICVWGKVVKCRAQNPLLKVMCLNLEFKYGLRVYQRGCSCCSYTLVRFCVVHAVWATPISCAQVSRSVMECSPACRVLQIMQAYIFVNTTEHNRDHVPGRLWFEGK
jgi:hypothetical protein